MEFRDFWNGRRVFVTGHSGFKGSWLSVWLQSIGAEITGYSLPPDSPSLFEAAKLHTMVKSVWGDVRDEVTLTAALVAAAPEVVIHMAAQPLVRESYSHPVETFNVNVMGTVHLLNAVRQVPSVRSVVNVTTDKVYDNKEWAWGYRETDPLGGYDPYSSSKACSELVTASFRSSFFAADNYNDHGVAISSARAGNVIGGGDWAADRLVPDCLRALESGRKVVVRNPDSVRPWQHVLEPLYGYLHLAQRQYELGSKCAGAWNFGPRDTDASSVSTVVKLLCQMWGSDSDYVLEHAKQPHEAQYLKLDCSKTRFELGWAPRWTLREALKNVVEWHRSVLSGEDVLKTCLRQIESYEKSSLLEGY